MKLAVTGATGFVGRYVVAELERRNLEAVLVCHRDDDELKRKHRVVVLDVHDDPSRAFEAMGEPDTLIHLAWAGLPNHRSLHHFEDELPAQYRFLKSVLHAGVRNLVVTGTCLEYGLQQGALSESTPTAPTNPYGLAKDTLRRQLEMLRAVQPFNFTWARCWYVFGEGQVSGSLFTSLQKAVSEGQEIFNMSGGEQLRDYTAVDWVAKILVNLALSASDNGTVSVCSGKPVSVARLVESWLAANAWNIKLNLGYYPYPEHEPFAFWGLRGKVASFDR
jgi:nucleoside-diphosphate-sugar epimerase